MDFDKNQHVFPSAAQREVWWWAVGLVPPDVSLANGTAEQCTQEVLRGCYDWYEYFKTICTDMYANINAYLPASARQYRDILENIAARGILCGDKITWDINEWDAYTARVDRSKAFIQAGTTVNDCLLTLSRTGLLMERGDTTVAFYNEQYPAVFHAMQAFEQSPDVRKTPARHHFSHCEFRQLFKSYSPGYDELLRRASDESLYIAHAIHDYAKTVKIQRYIHFGIIKYKYKGERVLDFNLYGDEYPTLRVNIVSGGDANVKIRLNPVRDDLEKIKRLINERITGIDTV